MARREAPEQLTLDGYFLTAQVPPAHTASFDIDAQLRNALSRALKECPQSRATVAARMTDLLFGDAGDGEVTKAQLDSWTAPSRDAWRFPLAYLPAFIEATGAVWLLDLIAERCGCKVVHGKAAVVLELGLLQATKTHIKRREAEIRKSVPKDLLDAVAKHLGGQG